MPLHPGFLTHPLVWPSFAVWLFWLGGIQIAAGQIVVPATQLGGGYSPLSGLQFAVDFPLEHDLGYATVRFTCRRATPAAASQSITIRFRAVGSRRQRQTIEVEQDFEMDADLLSATFKLLVPCYHDWSNCRWQVWVDGRPDPALSLPASGPRSGGTDLTSLLQTPTARRNSKLQAALNESLGGGGQETTVVWEDWPVAWLAYTPVDMAILTAAELTQMDGTQSAMQTALLRWVRSGGNLWIIDLGDQWERLDAVEAALRLPPAEEEEEASEAVPVSRGWHVVSLDERARQPVESLLEISPIETAIDVPSNTPPGGQSPEPDGTSSPFEGATEGDEMVAETLGGSFGEGGFGEGFAGGNFGTARLKNSDRQFWVRAYGMGTVAIQAPGGRLTRRAMTDFNQAFSDSLMTSRLNWTIRHGVDPSTTSLEFNNWLIPGVGVAPVGGFQLLLSLFVIVIGPLNYWVLSRAKKLPLLLVTVPAASAGVTLLLFAYGLVADGFGMGARVRSVTILDQRMGEGATWARLSYYAGLAPREGLAFSNDVAIYPIRPLSSVYDARVQREQRELLWDDGRQRLTRGWLASRTPMQYLSVSSRPLKQRLLVNRQEQGVQVDNQLGVDLLALAVQDHAGKHYWLERLAAGEKALLTASDFSSISRQLRDLFAENDPVFPVGGESDTAHYGASLDFNLLEGQLGAVVSPLARELGDGCYVAVTNRGIDLELGHPSIEETDSFHVVKGCYVDDDQGGQP